ncbi:hypothetical protein Glove_350g44 [Diversispora epigaea]|uniref:Uncharacterized protein n=1 Tax=Diversispora epigaea TaxID=1348612 RepID=A0A397HKK3_9GLOM|nr:hypothetical protein Glove_350g44 [Diversispora epigaea]
MTTEFLDSNNLSIKKFNETPFNNDHAKVQKLHDISVKHMISLLKKLENSIIFDLLIEYNELELDELVEYLQTHLINNNALLRLNFARVKLSSQKL